MEEVPRKLSWKWQPYLFRFKLLPAKWKQTTKGIFKHAAILPYSYLSCVISMRTHFAAFSASCSCQVIGTCNYKWVILSTLLALHNAKTEFALNAFKHPAYKRKNFKSCYFRTRFQGNVNEKKYSWVRQNSHNNSSNNLGLNHVLHMSPLPHSSHISENMQMMF